MKSSAPYCAALQLLRFSPSPELWGCRAVLQLPDATQGEPAADSSGNAEGDPAGSESGLMTDHAVVHAVAQVCIAHSLPRGPREGTPARAGQAGQKCNSGQGWGRPVACKIDHSTIRLTQSGELEGNGGGGEGVKLCKCGLAGIRWPRLCPQSDGLKTARFAKNRTYNFHSNFISK